jgi:hypothetical protein
MYQNSSVKKGAPTYTTNNISKIESTMTEPKSKTIGTIDDNFEFWNQGPQNGAPVCSESSQVLAF